MRKRKEKKKKWKKFTNKLKRLNNNHYIARENAFLFYFDVFFLNAHLCTLSKYWDLKSFCFFPPTIFSLLYLKKKAFSPCNNWRTHTHPHIHTKYAHVYTSMYIHQHTNICTLLHSEIKKIEKIFIFGFSL